MDKPATGLNPSECNRLLECNKKIKGQKEKGKIVTVILNGAGKSTLMKCISGLVKSRQGLFEGQAIESMSVYAIPV